MIQPPPVVSIIIAAYNSERFLSATLDSIRAQTFRHWECVIVDDGSVDQTPAVARRHAGEDERIRTVSQANGGPASARNRGLAEIGPGSKYITFMDSDDLWIPDALATLVGELDRFPEAIGVHGLADSIDENGRPLEQGFVDAGRARMGYDILDESPCDISEPTTFRLLAWTNRVYPPGVLLAKRSAYERAGPFDGSFLRFDDWDMIVRLSRYGDFRFLDKVILLYRRHNANLSARNMTVHARALRVLQHKIFFSPENTEEHKRTLKQGWRGLQVRHAKRKWALVREKLAKGQLVQAGTELVGIYTQLHRYVRGYPTQSGI